ncbi:MAG: peptide chain release factor N(5)-glutamine methyltransferase [Dinoroseobacter sp.]|nr:peptide chain release factor N(5)-glutamine methyltransferase [Dinoroseobacter sp.]
MIDLSGARSSAEALSIALAQGRAQLSGDEAARDAKLLLALAADVPVSGLTHLRGEALSEFVLKRFQVFLSRRASGEPVSHIRGTRAFWKYDFEVTQDVLDPRPETETLIEVALEEPFSRVLDLGTGSGCILLSLLAEQPAATGLGIDQSARAVEVAARNRAALSLEARAGLTQSNWYSDVEGHFDLIVANPPYIDAAVYETLSREVRLFEPRCALTPGADGTQPYHIIAEGAEGHLSVGGRLIVEVGFDQGPRVATILAEAGLNDIEIRTDLGGQQRVVLARRA